MRRFLCVLGCVALALVFLSPYNKAYGNTINSEADNLTVEDNTGLSNENPVVGVADDADLTVLPEYAEIPNSPGILESDAESSPFPYEQEDTSQPALTAEPEAEQTNTELYVLMYHDFVEDGKECGEWTTSVSCFREDLQWLVDNGYSFVLPSELVYGMPLPQKAVMLTFDDGYVDNYTLAYPILQEFQAKAVISPIVAMLDEKYESYLDWDMCRDMVASGLVEIGSHTFHSHQPSDEFGTYGIQRHPEETQEEYEMRIFTDIKHSIEDLEENIGHPVLLFAYPQGRKDEWVLDFIQGHFAVTLTTVPGSADISKGLYSLPRYNINSENRPWMYMK